jgi:hypothetical protein
MDEYKKKLSVVRSRSCITTHLYKNTSTNIKREKNISVINKKILQKSYHYV